jgi:pimeloyl-ACP methyl ester carboxylesterase
MKSRKHLALGLTVFLFWFPVALETVTVHSAYASTRDVHEQNSEDIQTLDHFVPHISTVPANQDEHVELFVRERFQDDPQGKRGQPASGRSRPHNLKPAVLMVQGATQPTLSIFDLPFEDYSWMAFLARAGFDVFAMDLTGYGRSVRPKMDDPCNTTETEQRRLLIPNPLQKVCSPSYPFRLTTSQTDWDEMDTVVDYIRQLRGIEKVSLVGWSLGGPRAGGYGARHPEKVDKLFLYAPDYDRKEPSEPAGVLPQSGVPMTVRTVASFFQGWDSQVRCENQFAPPIRDTLRSTILASDPVGSTWGTEAVWRAPVQNTRWGWNSTFARQVEAPTLIIRGDLDTTVPELRPKSLFQDLETQRVFVHVACAAHQLVWESQHTVLLRASKEWLKNGTFARQQNGSFFVDSDGKVHQE